MTIETKFSLGDTIWIIRNDSVHCAPITRIAVEERAGYLGSIVYTADFDLSGSFSFPEDRLGESFFATKQELLESL